MTDDNDCRKAPCFESANTLYRINDWDKGRVFNVFRDVRDLSRSQLRGEIFPDRFLLPNVYNVRADLLPRRSRQEYARSI